MEKESVKVKGFRKRIRKTKKERHKRENAALSSAKPFLSKEDRLSNESFIKRMEEKYGKGTFDFSKTEYTFMRRQTTVRCIKHDREITMWPQFMLRKKHCCEECLRDQQIEETNRRLESQNSSWRLRHEGFIKTTSKAHFRNIVTGEERIMVPCQMLNRLSSEKKQRDIVLQSKKSELDSIVSSAPQNLSIQHNLEETRILTVTCKIHGKSKPIGFKILTKFGKSVLDNICPDCRTLKRIESKKQRIAEKNRRIAEKDQEFILKVRKSMNSEIFSAFDFSESTTVKEDGHFKVKNIICKTHPKSKPFRTSAHRIVKGLGIGCRQCRVSKQIRISNKPIGSLKRLMEIDPRYSFDEQCFNYQGKKTDVACSEHGMFNTSRKSILRALRIHKETGVLKPICRSCFAESKSVQNALPELLEDWDFERNEFSPLQITKGSNKRVHWKCKRCKKPFSCKVPQKTRLMNGCPHCSIKTSSKIERIIFYFVECIFGQVSHNDTYRYGKGKHEKFSYDMMVDSLSPPLVLEYDGSYWHKGKYGFDRSKTKKITKQGFKCLRIRENPLKKIQKHDIQFEFTDYNNHEFSERLKGLIMEILDWLIANYDINSSIRKKIYEVVSESKFDLDSIPKDFFLFPLLGRSAEDEFPELLEYWDLELNGLTMKQISRSSATMYLWRCRCGNIYEMTLKRKFSIITNPDKDLDGHCSQCKEIQFEEKMEYTNDAIGKLRSLLPSESNSLPLSDIVKFKHVNFKCERCGSENSESPRKTLRMISDLGKAVCFMCKTYEEFELLLKN